jgi:hypothetical protein
MSTFSAFRQLFSDVKAVDVNNNPLNFELFDNDNFERIDAINQLNSAYNNPNSELLTSNLGIPVDLDDLPQMLVEAHKSQRKFAIDFGNGVIFTIRKQRPSKDLLDLLHYANNDFELIEDNIYDTSDPKYELGELRQINLPRFIEILNDSDSKISKNGSYFNYSNTTDLDLTRYQIYRTTDVEDDRHCLVFALAMAGINESQLQQISMAINGPVEKVQLKMIAALIDRQINLSMVRTDGKIAITKYGSGEPVNICIFKNHYFILENVNFTKAFINNYEILKTHPRRFETSAYSERRTQFYPEGKAKYTSSINAAMSMFEQKLFTPKLSKSKQATIININLSNIENEQRLYEMKEKKQTINKFYYADCETDTSGTSHELLMCGIVDADSDKATIYNNVAQMLEYVYLRTAPGHNPIIYFHNLKYDISVLGKHVKIIDSVEKDNTIYRVKVLYKKITIELRDSYKIISMRLADFSKTFDLDISKAEAINYDIYRIGMDPIVALEEYEKGIKPEDKDIFKTACEPFKVSDTYFNAMNYYKYYLNLDCLVLRAGIIKFDKAITESTGISLFSCLTISSLADRYIANNGAYDGVYEMSGNLRAFVGKAVYGGRCNYNKDSNKIPKAWIADYDATSLYPHAMERLAREHGLPIGKAKYVAGEIPAECNYYVSRVLITKINKKQDNPFIAVKGASTQYINEIVNPIELIIDKYTLEDYVEFHKIEYTVIETVYWNEGVNRKMSEIIKTLFEQRANYKKLKKLETDKDKISYYDLLQNAVKLIMNSGYGKSVMKSSKHEIIYKHDRAEGYIYKNFESISEYSIIGSNYKIKKLSIDLSYNRAHIGCAILSMSKRVMNEVMGTASDNKIKIFYQDTDSLHLYDKDVSKLETLFEKKYNRVLAGSQLGQFHVDFTLNGKSDGVVSERFLSLGKKSYINCLYNKNTKERGYHIRLKGIPNFSILNKCTELDVNPYQLFQRMADGQSMLFELNPAHRVSFQFSKGSVATRAQGSFKRLVKF